MEKNETTDFTYRRREIYIFTYICSRAFGSERFASKVVKSFFRTEKTNRLFASARKFFHTRYSAKAVWIGNLTSKRLLRQKRTQTLKWVFFLTPFAPFNRIIILYNTNDKNFINVMIKIYSNLNSCDTFRRNFLMKNSRTKFIFMFIYAEILESKCVSNERKTKIYMFRYLNL